MNDVKFISKIQEKTITDIDYVLALLNAHIITNCGASNARIGMFTYNKALGQFIKNNVSFMKEISGLAYDKYHFTMFTANFEKSMAVNKELFADALDVYSEMDA